MSDLYDEAMLRILQGTYLTQPPGLTERQRWGAALAAVAPLIAAKALREAADEIDALAEGGRELADRFSGYYAGVYTTNRHRADAFRARADEIEAPR